MKWLNFNRTTTVTHYLPLEIFFKLEAANGHTLLPLTGAPAQQLDDLERALWTFPALHPLRPQKHTHFDTRRIKTSMEMPLVFTQERVLVIPAALLQGTGGSARTSCTWRACGQKHFQTKRSKRTESFDVRVHIDKTPKRMTDLFVKSDLVPGPLNGMLDDRREGLQSAEWDLLLWGIPLRDKKYINSKHNDIGGKQWFLTHLHGYYRTLSNLAQ